MGTRLIPQVMGDEGLKAARQELQEFLVGLRGRHGASVTCFIAHGGQVSEACTDDLLERGNFQTGVYLNSISHGVVHVVNREGLVALSVIERAVQIGVEQFLEAIKIAQGSDADKYV